MPTLLTGPDCAVTHKGEFATKHLWVTPHTDDERWPAGEFTVQGEAGKGRDWRQKGGGRGGLALVSSTF